MIWKIFRDSEENIYIDGALTHGAGKKHNGNNRARITKTYDEKSGTRE